MLLAVALGTLAVGQMPSGFWATVHETEDGDLVAWDGHDYDWRAADGGSQVKVWVPPGRRARGLIVLGHGGVSGDSRSSARARDLQALASGFGFGVAGLHRFPGRQVYAEGAARFFGALDDMAALGHHPELAKVPIAAFGGSNGGATAYGLAAARPDRTLCFVSNVPPWLEPPLVDSPAQSVPGVIVMGRYDPFSDSEKGVAATFEAFLAARRQGARWAFVEEVKGHERGAAFALFATLLDRAAALRLRGSGGALGSSDAPEATAWLGRASNADQTVPEAWPADQAPEVPTSWLIDERMARAWRASQARNPPFRLTVAAVDSATGGHTEPGATWPAGTPVVAPGSVVELRLEALTALEDVEVWANDRRLDSTRGVFDVQPTTADRVLTFVAFARAPDGRRTAAPPIHLAVSEPVPRAKRSRPSPGRRDGQVLGSRRAVPPGYSPEPGIAADDVLVSYGLSAELEGGAFATGVAPFWSEFTDAHDAIRMTQETHGRRGSEWSNVHSADARLTVRAAHGALGVYLLFEITDNRFLPPSDDPADHGERDALDVLVDAHPSSWFGENRRWAVNQDWGLWLSTQQILVAAEPTTHLKIVEPSPFETPFDRLVSIDEVSLDVRRALVDPMRRRVQLFLPWTEVGSHGGLPGEPPVGARFAFSPSYSDADDDGRRKSLAWIDHTTPWDHAAGTGESPFGWGDIEIGPRLSTE